MSEAGASGLRERQGVHGLGLSAAANGEIIVAHEVRVGARLLGDRIDTKNGRLTKSPGRGGLWS